MLVLIMLSTPVILFYNEDLSHKNSIYYPDCITIQKEGFIPNVKECVEYVERNPNATGQNIVYDLTTTPAEKNCLISNLDRFHLQNINVT